MPAQWTAPHYPHLVDELRQPRLPQKGKRHVRERADAQKRMLAGGRATPTDNLVGGNPLGRWEVRIGKTLSAQSSFPMNLLDVMEVFQERRPRALVDGRILRLGQGERISAFFTYRSNGILPATIVTASTDRRPVR